MSKLNLGAIFELSKVLSTDVGQKTQEAWTFLSQFGQQVISALRNNLTFTDNMDARWLTIEVLNSTETTINAFSGLKSPRGITVEQVIDTRYGVDSFMWYVAGNGSCKATVGFTNSPAASTRIKVVLLIKYG